MHHRPPGTLNLFYKATQNPWRKKVTHRAQRRQYGLSPVSSSLLHSRCRGFPVGCVGHTGSEYHVGTATSNAMDSEHHSLTGGSVPSLYPARHGLSSPQGPLVPPRSKAATEDWRGQVRVHP